MEAHILFIVKTVIITSVAMSSIIPVDLLAFATNPSYLNTLVTTNTSGTDGLKFLAYDESFVSVIGENATTRQLYDFDDWEPFHEAIIRQQSRQAATNLA